MFSSEGGSTKKLSVTEAQKGSTMPIYNILRTSCTNKL